MNLLRGLYFPGTGPDRQFCPSLGGLFERIDLYLVDEEDRAGGEGEGGGDVCRRRAVLPLGGDRGRFLAMVGDIRAHADEYYEGFLASLSAPGEKRHRVIPAAFRANMAKLTPVGVSVAPRGRG